MYGQAGTVGLDSYEITAKNSAAVTLEQGDLVFVDPSQSDWAVVDGENIGCLSVELAVAAGAADEAPLVGVVTTTGPVEIGDWLKVKLVGIVDAKFNISQTGGSAATVGAPLTYSDKTGCFEAAAAGTAVVAYALEAITKSGSTNYDRTDAPKIRVVMFAPGIHCDMQ